MTDMVKRFVEQLRQTGGEAGVQCEECLPLADAITDLTADNARHLAALRRIATYLTEPTDAADDTINSLCGDLRFVGRVGRAALNPRGGVMPPVPVNPTNSASDIGPGDQVVAGAALRDRAIDLSEEFDTMMDVQANPCGAWMAIQEMACVIVAAKEPSHE